MRARNIKPGFFKNYDLADQGPIAQLLFAGLWCLADREGRLEDKPRLIKAEIFPYYDADVNRELTVMERLGFIRRYRSQGLALIEIVNFKKHQSPHNTEKRSYLPGYADRDNVSDCKSDKKNDNGGLTVNPPLDNGESRPDSLIPDSLIPDSLKPESSSLHSLSVDAQCERDENPAQEVEQKSTTPPKAGRTSSEKTSTFDLLSQYGVTGQLAEDFITHRKACGKKPGGAPITPTVMQGFEREAGKAGISVDEAVRIAIQRNWQGFNADWDWKKKAGTQRPNETFAEQRSKEMRNAIYSTDF
jgi:hypothetical protein